MHSLIDRLIINFDTALKTLLPPKERPSFRPSPDESTKNDSDLTQSERQHVAGLMRVNHAGEVCAQALYLGQAITAKLDGVKAQMQHAADEEVDHLAWCEKRIHELGEKTSWLNPIWFLLSLNLGMVAGALGDKWSLGFVVETERQVSTHLESHLNQLPSQDKKSKAILEQMLIDETQHADNAFNAGGEPLPFAVKVAMTYLSKVMTNTSYYI